MHEQLVDLWAYMCRCAFLCYMHIKHLQWACMHSCSPHAIKSASTCQECAIGMCYACGACHKHAFCMLCLSHMIVAHVVDTAHVACGVHVLSRPTSCLFYMRQAHAKCVQCTVILCVIHVARDCPLWFI